MSKTIPLVLLSLFLSGLVYSKKKKNDLSVNILYSIFSIPTIDYDRILSKRFSLGISGAIVTYPDAEFKNVFSTPSK